MEELPCGLSAAVQKQAEKPTFVLEVIFDSELWIWHAHFRIPGSMNDIFVLDSLRTLQKIKAGEFPPTFPYVLNDKRRDLLYYLTDCIYPSWALFMNFIPQLSASPSLKQKMYSAAQERVWEDIERAFGVLAMRFYILGLSFCLHDSVYMVYVIQACIIMHNMIVEACKDTYMKAGCVSFNTLRTLRESSKEIENSISSHGKRLKIWCPALSMTWYWRRWYHLRTNA